MLNRLQPLRWPPSGVDFQHALSQLTDSPQYQNWFHHEIGLSINSIFSLLRIDSDQRLKGSDFILGMSIARLF